MGVTRIELPPDLAQRLMDEAAERGVTVEELLRERYEEAGKGPEPKVEVLQAWWDPSMSTQRPQDNPYPHNCYVVLQVSVRVFNTGRRRYLARDFGAEITLAGEPRLLEHTGSLPDRAFPPPEQRPPYGVNVDPCYGYLVVPGSILAVEPDSFAEATLNFRSRGAGPPELSGESAPFRLCWLDQDERRFELEDSAAPVVTGIRPLR
jgi:hypothetical protein